MPLTEENARQLAESGPLKCVCGNTDPQQFAFVEWKNTVVAACCQCKRTYDYDRMDAHGTWKLSSVTGVRQGAGMDGAELIAAERQRQIDVEGFTAEHDDQYRDGELTLTYADEAHQGWAVLIRSIWPWEEKWFKPSNPVRNLVKAGALIAAEIDRLQRDEPRFRNKFSATTKEE